MRDRTKDRIKPQSPDYDRQAKSKVCGPWDEWDIEQALEDWYEDIMFNARTGDMVLNKDNVWAALPWCQHFRNDSGAPHWQHPPSPTSL